MLKLHRSKNSNKQKKGQSTVEFILLATAVIAVFLVFLIGEGSIFQTTLKNTVTTTVNDMSSMADKLNNSH